MIHVAATATVARTSREVLELVLDLDRYRAVDAKIRRVVRPVTIDDAGLGTARYWGRLPGLPPGPDTNLVALTRWSELTFTGAPRQPARLVLDFRGRFRCVDTDEGCTVTHDYQIDLRRPFRWLYEPLLAGWLHDAVTDEVRTLATTLSPSNPDGARPGASSPLSP